jgi:hypothetical protein
MAYPAKNTCCSWLVIDGDGHLWQVFFFTGLVRDLFHLMVGAKPKARQLGVMILLQRCDSESLPENHGFDAAHEV